MARLIDADALYDKYEREYKCSEGSAHKAFDRALTILSDAPTVAAAPVVHGHWNVRCESHQDFVTGEVDEQFYLECSMCRRRVWDINQDAIISEQYGKVVSNFPYCHCGAKMYL